MEDFDSGTGWLAVAIGQRAFDLSDALGALAAGVREAAPDSYAAAAARLAAQREEPSIQLVAEAARLLRNAAFDPARQAASSRRLLDLSRLANLCAACLGSAAACEQVASALMTVACGLEGVGHRNAASAALGWLSLAAKGDDQTSGCVLYRDDLAASLGEDTMSRLLRERGAGETADGQRSPDEATQDVLAARSAAHGDGDYDADDTPWLQLAMGPRVFDAHEEARRLATEVSRLLPGSPTEETAVRFAQEPDADLGLELMRLLLIERNTLDVHLDTDRFLAIADAVCHAHAICASLGDLRSAADVATALLRRAHALPPSDPERRFATTAALGWLAVAGGRRRGRRSGEPGRTAIRYGYDYVEPYVLHAAARLRAAWEKRPSPEDILRGDEEEAEGYDLPTPPADERETLVVVSGVARATGDKAAGADFDKVNCKALPLVAAPDPAIVRDVLAAEFPHADGALDTILADLAARRSVRLRPTLLLGEPGGGKSRLARRLMEELGIPHAIYPCGGVSDGSFAGTARRWSSGEPSLPLRLVRDREIANPGVVLDEVEKAGTSTHNGRLWDALIAMLESETAARWEDPYVQSPCNLSAFNWLCTANSLEGLPAPLLDRLRILRLPAPGHEHLPALAASLLRDLVCERGLAEAWATPLDPAELDALRRAWAGGSLRGLRRLVEAVLEARDATAQRH